MAGMSDFAAQATLDWETGRAPMPGGSTPLTLGNRFLALFTTAPTSDAGTGGTEVSGTGYARVQVAGALAANSTISTGSASITMNVSNPGWVVPGMNVFDLTNNKQIGTVLTYIGTALTLTANASNNGSGSTDSLQFSGWPASSASSGNEPNTVPANVTNGGIVTFAQAGSNWGTVTSFALYDAVSSGNMICWDYLGNFKWEPFSATSASPSVLTAPAHGYSNGDSVVVTAKLGGTLPTTAGSFAGLLTVAGSTTDTFNVGVNTTSTGEGEVRKVASQSIPQNITASFAASTLTLGQA